MQPSGGLFRKVALERLSSPEQLDQLMQVTTPRGWLAMIGLAVLLLVALVWGIFGSIPTTVSGQGILLRGSGIQRIAAAKAGQVTKLLVKAGDSVTLGQSVASIVPADGSGDTPVSSPYAGRILEIQANEGDVIAAGQPLMSLELSNEELSAIVYLPAAEGKQVQAGMDIQLSPSTVRKEEFGVLSGKVSAVSSFPATSQGMLRVLGSDELVRELSANGAPIEVDVQLVKADTPSGYQWSSGAGPTVSLESGTFCVGNVILSEQRPISLVFGKSS
ncbi:MAG TPA: NHLP bacteriocin system secretion protein [Aggregatilineales bacterium]|nr:NHLP bacteriocin system secretion protein [Aggregatilineales bacterium]